MNLRTRPIRLWASVLFLLGTQGAMAFQLTPIQATFQPSGAGAVQSFRLENPSNETLTIEISVARRTMALDGADELVPDEESFVVVPTQVVLKPQQVQAVRVQWVGDSELAAEQAFRLIAEQVPVELGAAKKEGGRLRMLVRYVASLYVAPRGAAPRLEVESAEWSKTADGAARLAVVVANRGTAHTILREARLALTPAGGTKVIVEAAEINGQNFLAGSRRRFLVAPPPGLGEGPLAGAIETP